MCKDYARFYHSAGWSAARQVGRSARHFGAPRGPRLADLQPQRTRSNSALKVQAGVTVQGETVGSWFMVNLALR